MSETVEGAGARRLYRALGGPSEGSAEATRALARVEDWLAEHCAQLDRRDWRGAVTVDGRQVATLSLAPMSLHESRWWVWPLESWRTDIVSTPAQLDAALKHAEMECAPLDALAYGRLVVGRDEVRIVDEALPLFAPDLAVLWEMARQPERVLNVAQLKQILWAGQIADGAVRNALARVRKRLGEAGSCIVTEPDVGYRFDPSRAELV